MADPIGSAGADDHWGGNPAGFIYGVLAVATVVAAESTQRETFGKVLGASALVIALYWLAHAYSHHLGSRLQRPVEWTLRDFVAALAHEAAILEGALLPFAALAHEAAILEGALLPFAALAGAWLVGASLESGVTAALWCAGVEIVVLEVIAALRRRLRSRDVMVETVIGVAMGLGILGVRVLLH